MSQNPLTQAYEMGYFSGINGHDPRLCPFPNMTVEWKAWNEAQRHGAAVRADVDRTDSSLPQEKK
jgi:ribosome modulation factor